MESVLGLEISEDKIKILELCTTEKGAGLLPLRSAELDLPAESIREGVIVVPRLVSDKITNFIKENNIYTKQAIALLSSPYVTTRISRLPQNLSDAQIRLNLETEVNQYQLFSGKDNILDFKKIEEISDEGIKKVNVLFAATFRALTESYFKTLELAGLELIGVDVPILSLIRLLDEVDFKSSSLDVTLLILLGKKYLEMCILKGNRPRFLHTIEIDPYDFQKDKMNFVDRFVSAIRLVVSFYQERIIHGEDITRIVISPWNAAQEELPVLLQAKLPQIPIHIANALGKIYLEKEQQEMANELRFNSACLLGAALRIEHKNPPFHLNLLLEQKTHLQNRLNQIYLLLVSFTLVFGVMIFSLGWVALKMAIIQRKISRVTIQLQHPSADLNKALAIKRHKEILSQQMTEAALINTSRKLAYFKNMAKASVLVPAELWLTDVILEDGKGALDVTGEAQSERPIFDYIASLSNSGSFANVELISLKSETGIVKFTVRCTIK